MRFFGVVFLISERIFCVFFIFVLVGVFMFGGCVGWSKICFVGMM